MCNFTFANICLYYLNLSVHSWLIFGISSEQIWLPSYAAYILSKGKAKWWAVLIWNKCGYHVKVFKVLWLLCCNALLGTSALDSYDSPSYSHPCSIYLFKHGHCLLFYLINTTWSEFCLLRETLLLSHWHEEIAYNLNSLFQISFSLLNAI